MSETVALFHLLVPIYSFLLFHFFFSSVVTCFYPFYYYFLISFLVLPPIHTSIRNKEEKKEQEREKKKQHCFSCSVHIVSRFFIYTHLSPRLIFSPYSFAHFPHPSSFLSPIWPYFRKRKAAEIQSNKHQVEIWIEYIYIYIYMKQKVIYSLRGGLPTSYQKLSDIYVSNVFISFGIFKMGVLI